MQTNEKNRKGVRSLPVLMEIRMAMFPVNRA
ncbi:hypothetical protein Pjdr2_0276 [Paenibacillus sp. JDR-2]|nr:hypothetical protein Pjdr2_0276 [Paenibacillus sp. JDR-2]